MKKNSAIVAVGIILLIALAGCGRGPSEKSGDTRVVARINDYELTVQDFKDESGFILETTYLSSDPDKIKGEVLKDIITKKILLQEAQKANFDKDARFMKEIERYWEQALLKLLLKKKASELAPRVAVDRSEVMDEYRKIRRKVFAELLVLDNKEAALELAASGSDFETVLGRMHDKIISGESAEWWSFGDLPPYMEKVMFGLKEGQIGHPIKSGEDWIVIRVLEEDVIEMAPFREMAPAIEEDIRERKTEEALEAWVESLKKQASVRINKQVLDGIGREANHGK